MKPNRFIFSAVVGLLFIGELGFTGMRVFAQNPQPTAQVQDCASQDQGTMENSGPDTDNVDLQCGDQNTQEAVTVGANTDTGGNQVDNQNSSEIGIEVDSTNGQDISSTVTPAVTSAIAQKTAEAYLNIGAAAKTELDDENGTLVYSVEFSNGTTVKVDAMTGVLIGSETGQD